MNENELRGLMRGMAQPEPPLQLNAEDIMAEGRKRSRRKTAAAGLVAVGAIAAISLPVTIAAAGDDSGHTGGGPTAPPGPVPATQTPRQLPSRPPLPSPAGPVRTQDPTRMEPPAPSAAATLMPAPPAATQLVPPSPAGPVRTQDPTRMEPPAPGAAATLMPAPPAATQLSPAQTPSESPTLLAPPRPKLAPSTAPLQTPAGTK